VLLPVAVLLVERVRPPHVRLMLLSMVRVHLLVGVGVLVVVGWYAVLLLVGRAAVRVLEAGVKGRLVEVMCARRRPPGAARQRLVHEVCWGPARELPGRGAPPAAPAGRLKKALDTKAGAWAELHTQAGPPPMQVQLARSALLGNAGRARRR
jgi:hypothetical protein